MNYKMFPQPGGSPSDEVTPAAIHALADPAADVRRKALWQIRDLPGDRSAYRDAVVAALADPAWVVREAAVLAAGQFADPEGAIYRILVALSLTDPKPQLRRVAAEVAGPHIEPERDYGVAIRHRFERQRMRAALALGHSPPERADEAVPLLRGAIGDSHAKVRLAALQGVSLLPRAAQRSLLPVVARKCFEADDAVRFAAIAVWGEVLHPRFANDPLTPLQPFAEAGNATALQAAIESLPAGHPLQIAWESLSATFEKRRFAHLLAKLCEDVLNAEQAT